MPFTLYRIVKSDPAKPDDFISYQARGRRPPNNPEKARLWDGLSAYETPEQARRTATMFPMLGTFIAEVEIPDNQRITYERTTTSDGHYTIWGEPDEICRCVQSIESV
ncbi:MAG: hypothetical protein ACR2M3_10840 [Thermomicrobiales bacterium]